MNSAPHPQSSTTDGFTKASGQPTPLPDLTRLNAAQARDMAQRDAPYLVRLMEKYPALLEQFLTEGAEAAWAGLLAQKPQPQADGPVLTQRLRQFKAQGALVIALADIGNHWPLAQVTRALSTLAEEAVHCALDFLLLRAADKGELLLPDRALPQTGTGIILLGMGKLGAYELNYSSDIDLIVLFDREVLPYSGPKNAQHFMNKLAGDLVQLLEERTQDGYVFRTDLRLRPDPMSTPLAVATTAALNYYETVGQNWERAAMIKARPIAGDPAACARYMRDLVPFIWRKTLDFATIADIYSLKRQMNAKSGVEITLPGHNIKTGRGGIREIEFFVQTLQLVWGGRIPELRERGTLAALQLLTQYELVPDDVRATLSTHYEELRRIEHRLQMRLDEQTHLLPKEDALMVDMARFCGYSSAATFAQAMSDTLHTVHRIYTDSMEDSAPLAVDGNLVFTGVEADPDTLATLSRMGYREAQRVSDIIQGWHRGHRRSTRSKRSRQVLTELIPSLLIALSQTANPDAAFFYFDDFLDRLPSGAQIFSLFLSRPEMLTLLADILGSAPALGDKLSNDPALLDSVLEPDFFSELPNKHALETLLSERLRFAHGFEQKMIYLRTINNEKRFQAGVHLLKHIASPMHIGAFLTDVAEVILQATMQEVWAEYTQNVPAIAEVPFAVVALGKLGGREMTFGSDLDIVFLYDDAGDTASDIRLHLSRISQRLVSALTLLTREGRLYEIDTRLRPGGTDGPLAVNLQAFDAYFAHSAWTYEFMALTRARVAATNQPNFAANVEAVIARHVCAPRDAAKLHADVLDMRGRIAKEFPTTNPWALKHIRGGMVDLDFLAQYLVLREAAAHPAIWHRDAYHVFEAAGMLGILDALSSSTLVAAKLFESDLMSLLRLSAPGGVITDEAPTGLQRLLTSGMHLDHFEALKSHLLHHEAQVREHIAQLEAGTF